MLHEKYYVPVIYLAKIKSWMPGEIFINFKKLDKDFKKNKL